MRASTIGYITSAVMSAWFVSLLLRGELTIFGSGGDAARALCLAGCWLASSGIRAKENANEMTERKARALGGTVLK